ncbi:hypothetical protein GYMLUDRAFT_48568 [Collybiopsis luxurians FD-317 M1]|uniref:DUF6534 domain-containing protein n=1 Tax=Collybiopsis luxurians FD-317 M1 TaxID=944289 RepID=A0A0D0C9K0_9AGAR|nr:hypothetical protein GYMLUDRAFT_48568 [Collybiopsis luxurians FD-317 M1]
MTAAETPLENPIILDITTSYGYMLIGTIFACILWGISCMQCFLYFTTYFDDSGWLKALVAALWMIDTPNVALMIAGLWPPLISKWGSVEVLGASPPDIDHHVWTSGLLALGVQSFFAWRIYHLAAGRLFRIVIPIFATILSLFAFASTIPFVAIALDTGTLAGTQTHKIKAIEASSRTCTVAADILITVSLLRVLYQHGAPSFASSREMMHRLTLVTINSGMWTATLAFISLILLTCQPNGFGYCIVEFPLGSLYYTTLLSNLNARRYIRGRKTDWNQYLSISPSEGDTSSQNVRTAGTGPIVLSTLNSGVTSITAAHERIHTFTAKSNKEEL